MAEAIFSLAGLVSISAWLGLGAAAAIAPGLAGTRLLLICGRVVPLGLCILYTYLLVAHWGPVPDGGFSSLAAVLTLFSVPGKMLTGWIHFLAFDLLVGRWLVDHALSHRRVRWPLLLGLPATFVYGPLGVLSYFIGQFVATHPLPCRERTS